MTKFSAAGQLLAGRLANAGDGLVVVLDIDGFNRVNERHGIKVADSLLAGIETSLCNAVPNHADACALGGDQFLVVVPGRQHAAAVAQLLCRAVSRTAVYTPYGRRVGVTATAGISRWPSDGRTGGAVLAAADRALRRARIPPQPVG